MKRMIRLFIVDLRINGTLLEKRTRRPRPYEPVRLGMQVATLLLRRQVSTPQNRTYRTWGIAKLTPMVFSKIDTYRSWGSKIGRKN